jgi:hypothetical protein
MFKVITFSKNKISHFQLLNNNNNNNNIYLYCAHIQFHAHGALQRLRTYRRYYYKTESNNTFKTAKTI